MTISPWLVATRPFARDAGSAEAGTSPCLIAVRSAAVKQRSSRARCPRTTAATSGSVAAFSIALLTSRQPCRPSGLSRSCTSPSKYARTCATDAPGSSRSPSFCRDLALPDRGAQRGGEAALKPGQVPPHHRGDLGIGGGVLDRAVDQQAALPSLRAEQVLHQPVEVRPHLRDRRPRFVEVAELLR